LPREAGARKKNGIFILTPRGSDAGQFALFFAGINKRENPFGFVNSLFNGTIVAVYHSGVFRGKLC